MAAEVEIVRADQAALGSIDGIIIAASAPPTPIKINPYPGMANARKDEPSADSRDARSVLEDIVVYIESVDPPFVLEPPVDPTLTQIGMKFVPRVLPVLVGQLVEFPNSDPFYHNVFSYSAPKRFDLGRYAKGGAGTVEFDEPGEVRVFCEIHSDMEARILVLENPYFTKPDETGRFTIPELPAGRHTVVLWHPDLPTRKSVVDLEAGQKLDLELVF